MGLLGYFACEAIGSVRTARSLRLRRYSPRRLPRYSRASLDDFVGVCRTMGLFDAGKMTIESIFGVGVVLLRVYLVIRGSSAGTVLDYTYFTRSSPRRFPEIYQMRD
jgi:hypothetical protein